MRENLECHRVPRNVVTIPWSAKAPDNPQETHLRLRRVFMLDVKKIPMKIGYYLAGFADGEGSFMVIFRKRNDYENGWKVSVAFNVSNKDKVILALFKRYLKCGTLRQRKDGVWYYEVSNFNAIVENVIPFFERFRFLSAVKKNSFSKFKKVVEIIKNSEHTTKEGIEKILSLRNQMNKDASKRRHTDEEILNDLGEDPQRPYAEHHMGMTP